MSMIGFILSSERKRKIGQGKEKRGKSEPNVNENAGVLLDILYHIYIFKHFGLSNLST